MSALEHSQVQSPYVIFLHTVQEILIQMLERAPADVFTYTAKNNLFKVDKKRIELCFAASNI